MNKDKIIGSVYQSARDWLYKNGYQELTVPHIVRASGACENVNTLYQVLANDDKNWYGHSAYLAQTGQLYLEANIKKYNKVFCDGPSFRAEDSIDGRHLTEFRMLEIELATDFDGLLDQMQGFVNHIVSDMIYWNDSKELGIPKDRIDQLKTLPRVFPQITYDQAIAELQNVGVEINWGDDLKHRHELLLAALHNSQPLFITRFPDPMWDHGREIEVEKFFNMSPDLENPGRVLSCDCIFPYSGEGIGSAQRVADLEMMVSRLKNSRMFKRLEALGGSLDDFSWYIEKLKTEGAIAHAGCGFGMARIIQYVMGEKDIRNCVNFVCNKESLI